MKNFARYIPCGRPIGYEDNCQDNLLCDSCRAMADLIAANSRMAKRNEELTHAVHFLNTRNKEQLDAIRRMAHKLRKYYTQEYIINELLRGNAPGEETDEP
jgi:hypothetical protein